MFKITHPSRFAWVLSFAGTKNLYSAVVGLALTDVWGRFNPSVAVVVNGLVECRSLRTPLTKGGRRKLTWSSQVPA
jgi:hypothetical protein